MSFEGRYQVLCENGHYSEMDALSWNYSLENWEDWKCFCGATVEWTNLIDDTNGEEYGKVEVIEKTPPTVCTCQCGNRHFKDHATFHIPEEVQGRRQRVFRRSRRSR